MQYFIVLGFISFIILVYFFFFSSRRRHTRLVSDWSSDVCSSDLQNDGRGHFTDVTKRLAPELERVGMVTDAVWRDVDGDGRPDLIVVGEWMPITIFRNAGGGNLVRLNTPGLEKSEGRWKRIVAGDLTGQG